ncbi:MAG: YiiX/YebB-like N1pC/P60 family cysteine hydrolase [Acinetobacter sp.]
MDPQPNFQPIPGDLLFLDLDCFAGCDAIEDVKPGINGARITHVGIFIIVEGVAYVIEAFPPEVRLTPINIYLKRALDDQLRPRICIGRLKPILRHLIPFALQESLRLRGLPYDQVYLTGENAYYCSELVVDAFKLANGGIEVFPEELMSFSDPNTGEVLEYWQRYYAYFGRPVPEGELGSHPASLSTSDKIDIIARMGVLHGWT